MTCFCIYKTEHVDGRYYIGKGTTDRVKSGAYKGSGVKIAFALKKNWDAWSCTIVHEGLTNEEAYALEGQLVTEETLKDPLCMNLRAGGGKHNDGDLLSRGEKISATRRAKFAANPELKLKQVSYMNNGRLAHVAKCANTPYTLDGSVFTSESEMVAFATTHGLKPVRVPRKIKTYVGVPRYTLDGKYVGGLAAIAELLKEMKCDFVRIKHGANVDFQVIQDTVGWFRWTNRAMWDRHPAPVKHVDGVLKFKTAREANDWARSNSRTLTRDYSKRGIHYTSAKKVRKQYKSRGTSTSNR